MSTRTQSGRSSDGAASRQVDQGPSNFALLLGLFRRHFILLLLPVGLFSAGAAAYVLTRKPEWRATQSLQIRDEVAMQTVMPGRFNSLDMMKMVQETIHETVRRHSVVARVLRQVAPPQDYENPAMWPSIEDIEAMQGAISLSPPNGAQFGRTEILLLSVKTGSIERSKKIVGLLARELQHQLNELRDKRAVSIENELEEGVRLAKLELDNATLELSEFETGVGEILVDLRSISNDTGSGATAILSQLNSIQVELRVEQQRQDVLSKQLEHVEKAFVDPSQVLSFSRELITAQPGLQKLKDEWARMEANTAKTLGQFAPHHSKAKAAVEAEKVVEQKILDEVRLAQKGLKTQLGIVQGQIARLEESKVKYEKQLQQLAKVRAPYASLVKMVEQKREVLNKGMDELARARSSRVAARTTNLITLLDEPYTGSRPEGTSKKVIIGAAGFAGLVSGIGLVFFAASPRFVGPINSQEDPVSLPDRTIEALGIGPDSVPQRTSLRDQETKSRRDQETRSSGNAQTLPRPATGARVPHSSSTDSNAPHDLEICRFDFDEEEEYEVDLDQIFDELRQRESNEPEAEPFKLEPKRSSGIESEYVSSEGADSDSNDLPDNFANPTTRAKLDEKSLREKHRREIEDLFRDIE